MLINCVIYVNLRHVIVKLNVNFVEHSVMGRRYVVFHLHGNVLWKNAHENPLL